MVVSELYCTTSKPSGLASVQTLSVAACANRGLSRLVNRNVWVTRRMTHSLIVRCVPMGALVMGLP
ncbi:hypothetical protein D9M70_599690 [compost metagenome]